MKRNFLLAVVFCLLFGFGTLVQVQAQNSSTAQLKSIHLFDMPQGVTEAELSAVLKEMNTTINRLGYKDAGYFLYKVEGEGSEKFRYFLEGVWPSAEAYKKIHEDKMYMESDKRASVLIKKIREAELYRRLKRVD
ncbi:MAG: hypothetical protein ABIN89_22490 [Chitinophagaceae bacterium]